VPVGEVHAADLLEVPGVTADLSTVRWRHFRRQVGELDRVEVRLEGARRMQAWPDRVEVRPRRMVLGLAGWSAWGSGTGARASGWQVGPRGGLVHRRVPGSRRCAPLGSRHGAFPLGEQASDDAKARG
jgi:hypothetical protein